MGCLEWEYEGEEVAWHSKRLSDTKIRIKK